MVHLQRAVRLLRRHPGIRVRRVSSCYETEPRHVLGQRRFLNAAARLSVSTTADELLAVLQGIERALKRRRVRRFGPRTLDLDLLLFGRRRCRRRTMVLPHPRMRRREFVLRPLSDIARSVCLAGERVLVRRMLERVEGQGVRLYRRRWIS